MIRPGETVRHKALAVRAEHWLCDLPALVADLEREWSLERLGRSLFELGLPLRRRHEILCDAAARIWRPAAGCGLPTGAEKGRWLADFIITTWPTLDRPCSERAIEQALSCAERRIRAHDDERAVLVHGDVHQWNTLQPDGGFKLIDPDGLWRTPSTTSASSCARIRST